MKLSFEEEIADKRITAQQKKGEFESVTRALVSESNLNCGEKGKKRKNY